MRKLFFVLISLSFLLTSSCDDGDIIVVAPEFDPIFYSCGVSNLVLYKTINNPSESQSLKLTGVTLNDLLEVDPDGVFEKSYTISTTNPFNYRLYSNTSLPSDLFCNDVPDSSVIITADYESTNGYADVKTVLTIADDDGIPSDLEDVNGNGNLNDDDTDGDTVPNYIDSDDDGDNILTANENPDPNGDGDFSDAQDTDGDGIPDYLDDDDDGDGVKTRDEENDSQDNNPANDITNSSVGPDYLNPQVATTVPATSYREQVYFQYYKVTVLLRHIDVQILSADELNFGELDSNSLTKTVISNSVFN